MVNKIRTTHVGSLPRTPELLEANNRFSAGDIAFGMIFHNLGRDRLGLASLYYVADVQVASDALCRTDTLQDTDFCN